MTKLGFHSINDFKSTTILNTLLDDKNSKHTEPRN